MKAKLSTKARTLNLLSQSKKFNIPKLVFFKVGLLKTKKKTIILNILRRFKSEKIILRSSALDEDLKNQSNAGKYDSVIVEYLNYENVEKGLNKILKKLKSSQDEFIVQKLILKPEISGVAFTRDINTNAPYYIINYDKSGKTNLVTSGKKNPTQKTLNVIKSLKYTPKEFANLLKILKKLEKFFNEDRLDVEFAIKNKKIYIFQVRNLKNTVSINDKLFFSSLTNIEKKIHKIIHTKNPTLSGTKSVLSNMSDWNPAEMIGSNSTPLAISLYSELITNEIWSKQRDNYGYKDVSPNRLMVNLFNHPYIDLRTDFNSFFPKNLNKKIEIICNDYFVDKLRNNLSFHDKIEFKVIPTCFELFEKKKLNFLGKNEFKIYNSALKNITKEILSQKNGFLSNDIIKIKELEKNLINFQFKHSIQKIFFLINLCKKMGTLPFAGIARCAFISTKILRDMVSKKLMSKDDLESFYNDMNTITRKFNLDLNKYKNKKISKKLFLKKYGHLRPLTYSISSKNYREGFNKYFNNLKINHLKFKKFTLNKKKKKRINILLKKEFKISEIEFFNFASESIKGREYSKFVFTKCIDEIFSSLKDLAKELNMNHNDLEYMSIDTILNSYNNLKVSKLKYEIKNEIKNNKIMSSISDTIKLPDVITDLKDIYYNYETSLKGNYITRSTAIGKVKKITKQVLNQKKLKLDDHIIFIENADPGFDFLFSHNIKGIVTKYGGANSHMAIRCMELNIPAIIGLGKLNFNFFSSADIIEINCNNSTINALK